MNASPLAPPRPVEETTPVAVASPSPAAAPPVVEGKVEGPMPKEPVEKHADESSPPVPKPPVEENRPSTIESGGGAGAEAPQIVDPHALRPRYPLRCRRLGHEGIAVISIEIGADGRVVKTAVAKSAGCPDLDRAALDAVRRARFRPARGAP